MLLFYSFSVLSHFSCTSCRSSNEHDTRVAPDSEFTLIGAHHRRMPAATTKVWTWGFHNGGQESRIISGNQPYSATSKSDTLNIPLTKIECPSPSQVFFTKWADGPSNHFDIRYTSIGYKYFILVCEINVITLTIAHTVFIWKARVHTLSSMVHMDH